MLDIPLSLSFSLSRSLSLSLALSRSLSLSVYAFDINCDGVTVTAPAFESAAAQGASIFRYLSLKYKSRARTREKKREKEREREREREGTHCVSFHSTRVVQSVRQESPTEQENEKIAPLVLCLRERPLFTRLRQSNYRRCTPRTLIGELILRILLRASDHNLSSGASSGDFGSASRPMH